MPQPAVREPPVSLTAMSVVKRLVSRNHCEIRRFPAGPCVAWSRLVFVALALSRATLSAASVVAVSAGSVTAGSLSGCVVLERKSYEDEPSLPPSIVTPPTARFPLDRIVRLEPAGVADDAGETSSLAFDVIVRDPNVNQRLDARVYVDQPAGLPAPPPIQAGPPVAANGRVERPYTFVLGRALFADDRCHKVELVVASEFVGNRTPADPGEFATAVWWVAPAPSSPGATIDLRGCP
jgi:hypothetical protein